MKKSLFVISAAFLAVLSGCSLIVPKEQYTALETEKAELVAQIEQLQVHVSELEEQNASLDQSISDRRERETPDPYDEKILSSLFLRPDLIPVGGEKMRYYTDICRVLGEEYAYAYAEDGRSAADMILSYERQPDDTYSWTLEVYDAGQGWQVASPDGVSGGTGAPEGAETPAPQEPREPQEPLESQAPQEPREPGQTSQTPQGASSVSQAAESSSSTPSVNVPVPNEAQQQKFREIASLVE